MGRKSTGVQTISEVRRIELRYLLSLGYLRPGETREGSLSWTDGSSINIETNYLEPDNPYIRLYYTITKAYTEEKILMDYTIWITSKPSNLGRGEVLYFICRDTGERCRILYQAYGSNYYLSRKAYNGRLYYETQKASKNWKYNTSYFEVEAKLKRLYKTRATYTYKGKETRRAKRMRALQKKEEKLDYLRFSPQGMGVRMRRLLALHKGL